jgi:hypothetical protein
MIKAFFADYPFDAEIEFSYAGERASMLQGLYPASDLVEHRVFVAQYAGPSLIKQKLKPFVTDYLSPARVQEVGLLNPEVVGNLLPVDFHEGAANSLQIWCLLTLMLWWQHFVGGRSSSEG